MKKLLYITAFPPNQKTAGQDYTRRLILDLLEKGYSVSLMYAAYPCHEVELPDSVEILHVIQPSIKNCFRKLRFHPFFTKRFDEETLHLIRKIAPKFDMIYFDFSQMHLYSLYIDHPCKVLMCHDVIAQKFSRKGQLQLPWIRKSEGHILHSASQIITFSQKDCDFIQKTYALKSLYVNFYLKNGHFDYENN